MWYFQHKNLLNNYAWFIVCITTSAHLCVLLALFFFYRSSDEYFTILIDRAMPNTVDITLLSTRVGSINKSSSSLLNISQKNAPHKIVTPSKKIAAVKKEPAQKQVSKATASQLSTKNTSSTPAKKTSPATKKELPVIKKNNTQAKQQMAPKKAEPIKFKEKESLKSAEYTKESSVLNQKINEVIVPNQAVNEECIAVSSQELELLKKIDYLQKELAHAWHPPAIQQANPACTLELFVNWEGCIETIKIIESSGVILFDAAARKATYDMHIPEWAKGKSITITLKA